MRKLLCIFTGIVISTAGLAQDIHFSQFFFAPQLLNPAETGRFDATYRANANYKSQWREVSQPYSTFAISGDGHFQFLPEKAALGIALMNDRAGDSRFNTFSILAGGAYAYHFDENETHEISGGLQMGVTQITIDYSALNFDNQFNGVVFDPNLPTGERFARNTRWYFNLNLGAVYTYRPEVRKEISAGWAMHNITRPDQSFFNDVGVQLPMRNSIYATASWRISESFDVMPAFRWMQQATFSEVILGSAVRYILMNERSLYRTVFAGYFGRFGDSGIAMVGFEVDDWRFAASYDINVSDLAAASRNRGGLEFSLQYLFNRSGRNKGFIHKFCPVYI
jgi:type IX secretion system PorP/SprF family membrane protein